MRHILAVHSLSLSVIIPLLACSSNEAPSTAASVGGAQTGGASNSASTVGGSSNVGNSSSSNSNSGGASLGTANTNSSSKGGNPNTTGNTGGTLVTASGGVTTTSASPSNGGTSAKGGATNSVGTSTATGTGGTNVTAGGRTGGGTTNSGMAAGGTTSNQVGGSASGGSTPVSGTTAVTGTTPVAIHGHLSVNGTHLVDEQGANVQLKGVSSQWLNIEKDGYALNLDALIWMRDNWKLSVIRAAMGAEKAGVDAGYTTNATAQAEMQRQVEIVINNAIKAGVYVIVDWHAHNALTQKAAAVAFFGDLSKRYGQYANVLFETFNEPLQVNWTNDLKPYHQAVVDAIRTNDTDTHSNVAILGTPQWDQLPTEAAKSPLTGTNLMYTVHFYSCDHNANSGTPAPKGDGISHLQRAKDALDAGLPLFITEWGATKADGGVGGTPVCATEADGWHEWMNANQIGWAAWKLDDCDTEKPADTSCLLKVNAPLTGGWNDLLNGHASYIVDKMKN